MKATGLIKSASTALNKMTFKVKKKSPEILIVTGIVGFVATVVTACVATTKATEVIEDAKDELDVIREAHEDGKTKSGAEYTQEDYRKDLFGTYVRTALKVTEVYLVPIVLGAGSITCFISGHKIMKERNLCLAASYAALNKNFKDYRDRVAARFGEPVEKELRYNLKSQEVETTVTDEKGKEKKVKEIKMVSTDKCNPSKYSMYSVFFDSTNPLWHRDPTQNLYTFKCLQRQANDKLEALGFLFLNDIYDVLRIPRTDFGQQVGWTYDLKNPGGDNFVEFEIVPVTSETDYGEKVDGFIIDFNVQGNILADLADHQFNV